MGFNKAVKREFEVTFSKDAQPVWFRIFKYLVLAVILYVFWESDRLWIIFLSIAALGLCIHFWYRYKTHAWTKSYGLWKHETERLK